MRARMRNAAVVAVAGLLVGWTFPAAAAGPQPRPVTPQEAEFFETRVRPVLAEHCVACHGPKKQMSGLRLDSREALLEGGDKGTAVRPGDPEGSRLVQAVRHA